MTGDLLGQALAYAARGWPVFPCKPGAKVPNTAHGFLDATTDPAVIRGWWSQHPRDNVAIATGSPAVDVLDVDVKPGGSGFAALNQLKRAGLVAGARALVRTRSGGLHLYFAGTRQECARLPRHFLDFKASGGYVVAPPSIVGADDSGPAGAYELAEERDAGGRLDWRAVRRLLDPPKPARHAAPPGAPGTLTARAREGIRRAVAESNTNGGWAGVLFWAGCRYGEKGASLGEALADLLPAAGPWNTHEERRASVHITNGWREGSGQARKVAG